MEDDAPPIMDEAPADMNVGARGTADLPRLSGSQLELLRALEDKDGTLGRMYMGALIVIAETGNPDRFAQCAHSMRELMEKLPRSVDVPMKAHQEQLMPKARNLEDAFAHARSNTKCLSGPAEWKGHIDVPLRRFLKRCDEFFDWFASHRPRRRAETQEMLTTLDASGRALPEALAAKNVEEWSELREYFVAVAHHRRPAEEEEFRTRMRNLGRFLIDRLAPKTFDDLREIDALVKGEAGDA